jgi:hypothetical protein
MSGIASERTKRSLNVNRISVVKPIWLTKSICGRRSGKRRGVGPCQKRPMLTKMNDTPMAEMSGASRGARRSGR